MILNYFEENVVCKTNHSQRFCYHISVENIFHLLSLLKAILLLLAEIWICESFFGQYTFLTKKLGDIKKTGNMFDVQLSVLGLF